MVEPSVTQSVRDALRRVGSRCEEVAKGPDCDLGSGVRSLVEELIEVALPGYVLALNPQEECKDAVCF